MGQSLPEANGAGVGVEGGGGEEEVKKKKRKRKKKGGGGGEGEGGDEGPRDPAKPVTGMMHVTTYRDSDLLCTE